MKFQLTVAMLSDWHVGSGAGRRGEIDRLIQRDPDELPYIPAKTLTGIWRDACELIVAGLDEESSDRSSITWSQWVDYLFGEQPALAQSPLTIAPRHAALSIRPAFLPESLKTLLKQRHAALKNALTFIKPGISTDANNGCAVEDFLRFEEVVRMGTVLESECELNLPFDRSEQQVACVLLAAGAKLVERLGGKRRRGAGKCQFQLTWLNDAPNIDWDVLNTAIPPKPLIENESDPQSSNSPSTTSDNWKRIHLTLEALTPIVIPARTIGNVVETLDYIPGTHLLRLILKQLRSLNVDLGEAVGQGDFLVTNATIDITGQAGKPVPACLFYEKLSSGFTKGGKVYNRLQEAEPSAQLKGYRKGYIVPDLASQSPYQTVETLVGTHNTIQDDVQRPTSDVGGVYSYEAIAAKTVLHAELRMRQPIYDALNEQQVDWWKKLTGNYRVGQSKKDDYGAIALTATAIDQSVESPSVDQELTVWLLSDVLIRDARLRPTTSLEDFKKKLQEELNSGNPPTNNSIKLELRPCEEYLSAMLRSNRVESWQVRWSLPRPSLVGLAAGSCVVFTVEGKIDEERLKQLELSGIGERRAEGYGQLCFNPPLLTQKIEVPEKKENQESKEVVPAKLMDKLSEHDSVFDYAHLLETVAWREAIRRAALFLASTRDSREKILGIRMVNDETSQPQGAPSMSQLGGLRSRLAQLRSPSDENAVVRWIVKIREKKSDKWSKTSDGLNKIEQLVTNSQIVWQHISQALAALNMPMLQELILTQNGEPDLKGELWSEAVQVLVDACIRAHKRDLEETPNKLTAVTAGASHVP
ncbi:RAMP superfamily CRISPR-associated protein [Leptolyngbya sp. AN03gr2]|uniref:RAMP superfamily CRISPR-associated protein n=1 Tax=unclassified Leptolyngbya TaxID=2650499 RepID=UPI003D3122C1